MKAVFAVAASAALLATMSLPAAAQDRASGREDASSRPIGREDVLSPVRAAPENNNIVLDFGQTKRIYFTHPIKSLKVGNDHLVRAIPQTDHIVAFTGLAPGESSLSIEGEDGQGTLEGTVTIIRASHEVKIYVPPSKNLSKEEREAHAPHEAAGYYSIQCNAVGCDDISKPNNN